MDEPTRVFYGRGWLCLSVLLATAALALRAGPGLAAGTALAGVPTPRINSTVDTVPTPPEVGMASLLRSLADLGQLCWLREDRCLQFSSYDRSGGNGDSGHYLNGEVGHLPDDTAVLAEMDGPGAVVRLWSANPAGTLRVYLDGSEQPVLEAPMADLFAGKVPPLAPPLATRSSGGFVSYFPIPYQKHCRITVRGAGNLYYQVDYRTFAPGTVVKPFARELDTGERAALAQAEAAWKQPGPDWSQVHGWRRLRLRAGETAPVLEQAGPGTIRGLYLRLPRDLRQARRLVLCAYWDGEPQPSIEAPLPDLFGSGWQSTEIDIAALPLGRSKEGWYFRLPMPFRRSARLTLENETERTVELHAAVEVVPGELASPPGGWGYLHARWDRGLTRKGTPHEWVHVQGRGQFVGVVQSMSAAPLGFLEGDERIWSDGDKVWNGTGTEDYFNSGWYFNGGPVSQPLHGAVKKSDAGVSAYRFHLNDAVPFQHELRAEIEHGGTDDTHDEDYASVAFWYAARPVPAGSSPSLAATFLAPPYQRFEAPAGAIVPAQAIGTPPPGAAMGWLSPPLTGTPALLITDGHHAVVPFAAEAGHYRVRVAVDRQAHLGRLSLAIDGRKLPRRLRTGADGDPEVVWLDAGEVDLSGGEHTLEMRASRGMVAVRAIVLDAKPHVPSFTTPSLLYDRAGRLNG